MRISRSGFGFRDAMERSPLEQGVFEDVVKIKIGIVGISSGAGATFIASRIAYELGRRAEGVCYVEAAQGPRLAAHSLSLAKVFDKRNFADYFGNWEQGLSAGSRTNLFENVNWVLRNPYETAPEAKPAVQRLFSASQADGQIIGEMAPPERISPAITPGERIPYERIPGRYLVVDFPALDTLNEMDLVVCVADPLPSALIPAEETVKALRENRIRTKRGFSPAMNHPTPCLWVLNKDNPRVSHRELERFMKIKFDFVVPMIDPKEFYRAEYGNLPIFKAILRPCKEEERTRKIAAAETEALTLEIRKLLPIL